MSNGIQRIKVIDSHTGGEPTRLIVSGGPDLGSGPLSRTSRALSRQLRRYPVRGRKRAARLPVLFHSPYEAAAGFIVGHRISIRQRRALVARMAQELGERIDVRGQAVHAFPSPHALLRLSSFAGISAEKIERLHGIARAALEGLLDRARLRSMPIDDARAALQELRGVGPFFADGILHRGAGVVDDVPNDHLTPYAVHKAYGLPKLPSRQELLEIAESWKPFRMWATVLLHIRLRREDGLPKRGAGRGAK